MANYVSNLKWAWQAQFLSHILVILKNNVFFEDKQMILLSLFDISTGFRFQKNLKSLPIQFLSHPWIVRKDGVTPLFGLANTFEFGMKYFPLKVILIFPIFSAFHSATKYLHFL